MTWIEAYLIFEATEAMPLFSRVSCSLSSDTPFPCIHNRLGGQRHTGSAPIIVCVASTRISKPISAIFGGLYRLQEGFIWATVPAGAPGGLGHDAGRRGLWTGVPWAMDC